MERVKLLEWPGDDMPVKVPESFFKPEDNGKPDILLKDVEEEFLDGRRIWYPDEDWPGKDLTGYGINRSRHIPPGSFIQCEKSEAGYLEMVRCYQHYENGDCECKVMDLISQITIRPRTSIQLKPETSTRVELI